MKVIITEAGAATNVGSMALIENAIIIAREKHPGCHISVFCLDSKSVSATLVKDGIHDQVITLDDLFVIPKGGLTPKAIWLIQTICWLLYSRLTLLFSKKISKFFWGRRKKNLQEAEQAEYIYCIGAERINDIYYKTALLSLYAIGTYIRMGKKLIHLSLTIGPVFNKSTINLAKNILNHSYAILTRDRKTFDIMQDWHCKAPIQYNSYDIALLQQTDPSKAQNLITRWEIKPGFVGVSCIHWLFKKANGPTKQNEYEDAIAQTLDYIIEQYGYQIVFTPTVINSSPLDDAAIGKRIQKKMKNSRDVIAITQLLTPVEMATLYSQCTFSIVTRMHAAILCSGAGGHPVIAINYLYKLREYMKNIQCEEYSIDIDYTNPTSLKRLVDKLMSNYDHVHNRLKKTQLDIRKHINKEISNLQTK